MRAQAALVHDVAEQNKNSNNTEKKYCTPTENPTRLTHFRHPRTIETQTLLDANFALQATSWRENFTRNLRGAFRRVGVNNFGGGDGLGRLNQKCAAAAQDAK